MRGKLLFAFSILFSLMLAAPVMASIGASPSRIVMENALKGETYDKSLRVFNMNEYPVRVEFSTTGNFTDWVTFYDKNDYETPISTAEIPGSGDDIFLMRIVIPGDTANGEYTGEIITKTVNEGLEGGEGAGATVSLGIKSKMKITVTGDEVLAGEVLDINIFDIEVNRETRVMLQFKNTGNVLESPVLKADIMRDGEKTDDFEFTAPDFLVGELRSVDFRWDTTGNPPGNYTANIKVYLKDEMIYQEETDFIIFERGVFTAHGELMELNATQNIALGGMAKIEARFWNRGDIDMEVKLKGEIYLNDELIDTAEGDGVMIKKDHFGDLDLYYKPGSEGAYTISPSVYFEGKELLLNPITVNVGSGAGGATGQVTGQAVGIDLVTPGIAIIILIIVIGAAMTIRSRRQPAWKSMYPKF